MSTNGLGPRFARAIADRDIDAFTALLAPEVDFKALTPGRFWEGSNPDDVLDTVFGHWFEETDRVDELVAVTEGPDVEDTHHVGYRFAITNPDGAHTVEQQAYYRADGDRIGYLRVVCSGYRPAAG